MDSESPRPKTVTKRFEEEKINEYSRESLLDNLYFDPKAMTLEDMNYMR